MIGSVVQVPSMTHSERDYQLKLPAPMREIHTTSQDLDLCDIVSLHSPLRDALGLTTKFRGRALVNLLPSSINLQISAIPPFHVDLDPIADSCLSIFSSRWTEGDSLIAFSGSGSRSGEGGSRGTV